MLSYLIYFNCYYFVSDDANVWVYNYTSNRIKIKM
nr:MAG TPA: hypothetical protein [Caudoviricetes sp.]